MLPISTYCEDRPETYTGSMIRLLSSVLAQLAFLMASVLLLGCGGSGKPSPAQTLTVDVDTSTSILTGRIGGLKVGDPLERCLSLLGEPTRQEGGGAASVIVYEYPEKGLRVELSSGNRAVHSIALLLAPDETLPQLDGYTPQSVATNFDDWAPYKSATVHRWVSYTLPAFRAWALLSPDSRKCHAVILTAGKSDDPPMTTMSLPPPEPIITVVEGDEAGGHVSGHTEFSEILAGDASTWEQGSISFPMIWRRGDEYWMAYEGGRSSSQIGFARSADGISWSRDPRSPLGLPQGASMAMNPVVVPGSGQMIAFAYTGSGQVLMTWQLRENGTWSPRGQSLRFGSGATWQIAPQSVVRVGDRWYMFYYSANFPQGGGRVTIQRCESVDGTNWTNHKMVLQPSASGFDAGAVSCPTAYYDAASRTWTLWYLATSSATATDLTLCRAFSSDGINFSKRELFLRPETLNSSIASFGPVSMMTASSGTFLYMGVYDSARTRRIIRLDLRNPHLAPPLG